MIFVMPVFLFPVYVTYWPWDTVTHMQIKFIYDDMLFITTLSLLHIGVTLSLTFDFW